ncbi:CHAT domain-containing protein [Iningainema tapete]|uniref:CHAT domain-containing protein n=1 Tax=Iningainema tapete BLCC-T55 TaxID=2748662 RepID=A0A8J6XQV5_9CYAN|nr:CHAT domain-containing protein [Iningainema tapete]MBD2776599.1 CHAT domain-containing protein [Iningainema tapete BLCC-T55]
MARKRFVLFSAVHPVLKYNGKKHRQITAIWFALITLIFTLITPVLGENVIATRPQVTQTSHALELEQQGKEYYDTGRFAEAVEVWQKAADAYHQNEEGKNRNLINKAKALQSLGLYPEACGTVMQAFTIFDLNCEQLINNNQNINNIKAIPDSLNKIIGLRLLGQILQRFGKLDMSQRVLEISLQAAKQYPQEKSAVLLSLGNIERVKGNKTREQWNSEEIFNFITDNSRQDALAIYKQALYFYNNATNQDAPTITQMQAELNQLSIVVEMQEWWDEQSNKQKDLLNRQKDSLNKHKDSFTSAKLNDTELKERLNNIRQQRLNDIQDDLNNIQKQQKNIQNRLNNMVKDLLPKIKFHLGKLPQGREAVYAKINFAHSLIRLKSTTNKDYFSQPEIAKLLSQSIQQARSLGDKQAEAEALSNLALAYELQVSQPEKPTKQDLLHLKQAKNLIQQALHLSEDINVDNRQVLYHHRRLLGRILKEQGNIKAALASYAEAWNILQSLRADLVTNTDNQFSFRQNVEPVYREFIDLLLLPESSSVDLEKLVLLNNNIGADNLAQGELKNPLDIARLVMESLQLAELDNFFQEPCSPPVAKPVQIDNIDRDAAVIYPIILDNRLEVILSRPGQPSRHYATSIKKKEVKNTLLNLANIIYNNTAVEPASAFLINSTTQEYELWKAQLDDNKQKFLQLSQKVYDWLIRPLELDQQIKTLVFVLDRPFQTIPIAALHDGKNYLIEKYNIVLNLGQQLIEPKQLKSANIKILAAGVSEQRSERGRNFGELKNVETELTSIENLGVPTKKILNQTFTKNTFTNIMKSSPTVVHLATHGVFSSNREQTFILTGDSSIGIDDFQSLLNPKDRIRNKSIELLVLSACQTALGDDRAALGIAGVVLRFGASSTVATLWPVSDTATAKLMKEFYQNLTNRNKEVTRAEALRSAQLFLLKDLEYNHPFYWAPFVLVGNWL